MLHFHDLIGKHVFMIDRRLIIDLRQLLLSVTQTILIAPDGLHLSVEIHLAQDTIQIQECLLITSS